MRLSDLEPKYLKREPRDDREIWRWDGVELAEADGIEFLCPKCFAENQGPVGTHVVICWRPRVPASLSPGPGRWELVGTGFEDLSLVAGSSSVALRGGCNAHFLVQNGAIQMIP